MSDKIEPIRVKLLEWKAGAGNLWLKFEKVIPYVSARDFSKKGFEVNIYADFGNIELSLTGVDDHDYTWLNTYLNDGDVFIEEEEENELSFIEGTEESKYDWQMSYVPIPFKAKTLTYIPISAEEWKQKYIDMALQWDKIFHERNDIQHLDFLELFIQVTKTKIKTLMPDVDTTELTLFKNSLNSSLDSWMEGLQERKVEMEKAIASAETQNQSSSETQRNFNNGLKSFWTDLLKKFKT